MQRLSNHYNCKVCHEKLVMATVKIVYILNSILNRHQQTFVYQPFNQQDKFNREKDSTEGYDNSPSAS